MSKFIEKLKNHTQLSPAPIGFGKAPVQEKPRILLVAGLTLANIDNLAEYINGADAALLKADSLSSIDENLPKLSQSAPDVVWGGRLTNAHWDKAENTKIKADFLVFSPEMPLFDLPTGLGRILEIDVNITDTQLRAIDELPVEAVLFSAKPEILNWQYLIMLQRLDNLLVKPLLAVVPSGVTSTELQTLWGVGVDGVVIELEAGQVNRLKELRQEVEKASFPLPRKSKKAEVRLPFISQAPPADAEEEEEDE
jgi:hypothetical protein